MDQNTQKLSEFSINDLFQAALLYTKGLKLLRVTVGVPRSTFVFADRAKCEDLCAAYWRKEAQVDAASFTEAYCSLKTRLRQR
ncbi:MAG: hypothetical protein ACE14U_04185 [Candidatus Velamenicoccus archaeovorus]